MLSAVCASLALFAPAQQTTSAAERLNPVEKVFYQNAYDLNGKDFDLTYDVIWHNGSAATKATLRILKQGSQRHWVTEIATQSIRVFESAGQRVTINEFDLTYSAEKIVETDALDSMLKWLGADLPEGGSMDWQSFDYLPPVVRIGMGMKEGTGGPATLAEQVVTRRVFESTDKDAPLYCRMYTDTNGMLLRFEASTFGDEDAMDFLISLRSKNMAPKEPATFFKPDLKSLVGYRKVEKKSG
ncbi:MAG: hypothetical protein KDC26_13155 [Armatimonadetes bacterium]|nr:hypothetical protein [Armatimonadota bacterium]